MCGLCRWAGSMRGGRVDRLGVCEGPCRWAGKSACVSLVDRLRVCLWSM